MLGIFLWWQLTESTLLFKNALSKPLSSAEDSPFAIDEISTTIDPKDKSLFYLRQGDLFAIRSDWQEAEEQYLLSLEAGGGLPALRKLAQVQLQRRNIAGVRDTIKKLKKAGARAEDILLLESIVMLRQGELVQANALLELSEDSPQKNYGIALLSIIEGNHEVAKEKLDLVVNGWEPVLRANARTLLSAYQEFSLFPESTNIHLITLLSRSLAQVNECELALPLLVQVTQLKNNYRDAWIVQGYCELVTERPEQSLASLEQAYTIDPRKSEIQYFLGRAYADMNEHQNAIRFYNYALVNGFLPASEVRLHIADSATKLGNKIQALQQYEILIKDSDSTLETFYNAIALYLDEGLKEKAYNASISANEKYPENAAAQELLGWAAMEAGHFEEAREALNKALEISPFLKSVEEKLKKLEEIEENNKKDQN